MKQARWAVALHTALFLVTVVTTSAQALSKDDANCRKFIGQKVRKLTDAFLNEKRKCHEQRLRGKISAATDCNDVDDPGFPESGKKRIQKQTSALTDKIETRCAKASSPAGNGYTSCAAPCDAVVPTVTTYTDVAACLSCLSESETGDAIETAYGASPPVQGERNDLWKCQNAYLGKALRAYVKSLMSEQSSCQYKEDKGSIGATDCESADLRSKVAKALAKFNKLIAKCTDAELAGLDSCASTVVAEQSCLPAAGDLVADNLFNAVYPLSTGVSYPIVGTNQTSCYDNSADIACPSAGASFYGQDAQHNGTTPSYTVNGDGTVTDNVTGLMWQQDPGSKKTYAEAVAGAAGFNLAGYTDWRLPTIKELYSLILFSGEDPSGETSTDTSGLTPFIDDSVFAFEYGDTSAGERIIDSQWATSNVYGSTVFGDQECFFGVNFADGRIKCYPTAEQPGGNGGYFTIYVRGNSAYGTNDLTANNDGTVSDAATGLMWMQSDNGEGVIWEDALAYCEDLSYAGHDDWRLPNAKELQSIVDYARAPDTTSSAAIDPLFSCTSIINEAGQSDYPFYWTSTTHVNSNGIGDTADYVSFGRAMGYWMNQWQDVHGAGAQRSDPKAGNPADYPTGHGPQGDAIRIYNYVRCVRDAAETPG